MIRPIGLAACLGLAACSPAPQAGNDAVPTQKSAEAPAPAPEPGQVPAGGAVHGSVSDLTADVSGLTVRTTDYGRVVDLPTDTLFAFDSAELEPGAETNLAKVAELLRSSPPDEVRILGHTDAKGEDAYNQTLSEARAQAVADWMGQQVGVRTRRFVVEGKGESAPIAPNATPGGGDDPDGRAKNRRVEVVLPD
ncbi:OmpA family protein [Sphingomonas sp. ac-8]|uniref:OmpA family protein n=1 Tax=Sphingomonas sp. ac-8 TaxID=3242977 RepID=UPI003A8076B7